MSTPITHGQLRSGSGRSIWGFLLVSFLAHAFALVYWPAAPPAGLPGGGALQVRLVQGTDNGDEQGEQQRSTEQAAQDAPQAGADSQPLRAVKKTPPMEVAAVADSAATAVAREGGSAMSKKPNGSPRPVAKVIPEKLPQTVATKSARDPAATAALQDNRSSVQQAAAGSQAEAKKPDNDETAASTALSVATAAAPVSGERGGLAGDANLMIQAALREALLPYFDYPMLARRRGWEGRVRIALLVQPDGDLTDMQVLESSGYRVLDQAALRDLRELGRLPQATALLDGRQMDVILPIQYRFR